MIPEHGIRCFATDLWLNFWYKLSKLRVATLLSKKIINKSHPCNSVTRWGKNNRVTLQHVWVTVWVVTHQASGHDLWQHTLSYNCEWFSKLKVRHFFLLLNWYSRARSLPGPRDGVLRVGVADGDRLHRDTRIEPARLERDQAGAVRAGAFGEYQDLEPETLCFTRQPGISCSAPLVCLRENRNCLR